jgi:hypothetical protein
MKYKKNYFTHIMLKILSPRKNQKSALFLYRKYKYERKEKVRGLPPVACNIRAESSQNQDKTKSTYAGCCIGAFSVDLASFAFHP